MAEQSNVKPLTTDELRSNASNWTLACDVGLLAHLQQFSEEIIKKAGTTESSLNSLLDRVEETCTNFNNVSNQFLSLQNSQFLENRVYDDETPTEDKLVVPPVEEETQQQHLAKYKEAVVMGLNLLDTHYEQVQVLDNSDSDEDEPSISDAALVWRAKPRYTAPLPLVIGSAEWWADDSVGLGEFMENEDTEPGLSLSESEGDNVDPHVEKRVRRSPSSSSSESAVEPPKRPALSYQPQPETPEDMFKPVENIFQPNEDLFRPTPSQRSMMPDPLFGGDDGNGLFGPPASDFFKNETVDDKEVYGSIQKPMAPASIIPSTNSFSDQKKKDALFGEDDEVDDLFGVENAAPAPLKNPAHSQVPNAFTKELMAKLGTVVNNQETEKKSPIPEVTKPKPSTQQLVKKSDNKPNPVKPPGSGLFGEDDDDEDDDFLFGGGGKKTVPLMKSKNVSSGLFDDEPDDLFSSSKTENKHSAVPSKNKKEPLLAVSGRSGLFDSGGDLFSDDLDGDLFAPKSTAKTSARVMFDDDAKNSPLSTSGMKSSTPAVQGTPAAAALSPPADDLFGSISSIVEQEQDPGEVVIIEDESKDLGFIENSNLNDQSGPGVPNSSKDSPANWFQPQLSSTRAAALSNETTGYKTGTTEASSSDVSNVFRKPQLSSVIEDNTSKTKSVSKLDDGDLFKSKIVEEGEGLFAASSKSAIKWKLGEEVEDLFSNSSSTGPVKSISKKEESLTQENPDDVDDLFSKKIEKEAKPENHKTNPSEDFFSVSRSNPRKGNSLFDEEDDTSLFDDGKAKLADNKSVSSSRSSIFEDHSKSTLPSIFTDIKTKPKGNTKISLFDDVDDDFDLFSKKPKVNVEKDVKNKNEVVEKITNNEDDIFKKVKIKEKNVSKMIADDNEDDGLFGSKSSVLNYEKKKSDLKPSIIEAQGPISFLNDDDLFSSTTSNRAVKQVPEQENTSLFADESLEDDDDLFGIKKRTKSAEKMEEKKTSKQKAPSNIFDSPDDDLFGEPTKPPAKLKSENKEKVPESRETIVKDKKPELLNVTKIDSDPGDDLFGNTTVVKPMKGLENKNKEAEEIISKEPSQAITKPNTKTNIITNYPDSVHDDLFSEANNSMSKTEKETLSNKENNLKPSLHVTKNNPASLDLFGEETKDVMEPKKDLKNDEKMKQVPLTKPKPISKNDPAPLDLFGEETKDVTEPKNEIKTEELNKQVPQTKPKTLAKIDPTHSALFSQGTKRIAELKKEIERKDQEREEKEKEVPQTKPKPPTSLNITKNIFKDDVDGEVTKPIPKKIGKLNIPGNLKINPAALLPGAKLAKPQLEDKSNEESSPTVDAEQVSKPSTDDSTEVLQKPVGSSNSGNMLTSALRDRARIQVKRRPQSRKARQEAIRTSGMDWGLEETPTSPGPTGSDSFHSAESSPSPAFISPVASNPLSTSTDEEDYFHVPDLDSNFEKEENIFGRESKTENEDLLFTVAPVISPTEKEKDAPLAKTSNIPIVDNSKPSQIFSHKIDLFGENSSDTGLFSEDLNKEKVPSSRQKAKLATKNTISLFGDSDDDDTDIFSGNPIASLPQISEKPAVIPPVPKSRVGTVKEPFIDPLGLLQDESD